MQIKEKATKSMISCSAEIMPYLPYLLQDIWEIGSSAKDIIDLIRHYIPLRDIKALELACGKGAVAINIAKRLSVKITGIDSMSDFIQIAKDKAKEMGVEELCEFKTGDIIDAINREKGYDVVILNSLREDVGNLEETLRLLSKIIIDGGYIVIDDSMSHDGVIRPTKKQWLKAFDKAKLTLINYKVTNESELIHTNRFNQDHIETRAFELEQQHPNKAKIFKSYVSEQQERFEQLEADLIGVTWLLKKRSEK